MERYSYRINGNKYEVEVLGVNDDTADVRVNGEEFKVEMERGAEPARERPVIKPAPAPAPTPTPASPAPAAAKPQPGKADFSGAVTAPLPGVIREIRVRVGDQVEVGQTVVVLEAMKMANNLDTEVAGKVKAILVQEGESVMEDMPLVVIE